MAAASDRLGNYSGLGVSDVTSVGEVARMCHSGIWRTCIFFGIISGPIIPLGARYT